MLPLPHTLRDLCGQVKLMIQPPQSSPELLSTRDRNNAKPIRPASDQLILEITNRLAQEFQPENIFLFGSHAWGTPHADSDIDILIIVSTSDLSPSKRSTLAYRCLRDIPYPLDILVKTRQEIEKYAQVPLSLEHQILMKGRCLYGQQK
jgi:uncharacterized protein